MFLDFRSYGEKDDDALARDYCRMNHIPEDNVDNAYMAYIIGRTSIREELAEEGVIVVHTEGCTDEERQEVAEAIASMMSEKFPHLAGGQ